MSQSYASHLKYTIEYLPAHEYYSNLSRTPKVFSENPPQETVDAVSKIEAHTVEINQGFAVFHSRKGIVAVIPSQRIKSIFGE